MKKNSIVPKHILLITASALMCIFFVYCNNAASENSIYNAASDSARLTEKHQPNTFTGTIKNKNSVSVDTLTASLTGNPRTLPLYGFNGNNIRGPSWENKSLMDSITSLHLRIIRYPGGSIGDWWDWRKGWFNNQSNLPDRYKTLKPFDNSLDALKLLTKKTGCEVVFTLNMISSNLDDQVNMLKYADSIGITIKWIELGNEYNVMKSDGIEKFLTPANYGKESESWIKKLKSVFPNAKIAVVGGDKQWSNEVNNWNSDVMKNAPDADAIVAHLYPYPANILDDLKDINFQKLYKEYNQDYIKQGFGNVAPGKSIWITEYNVLWSATKQIPDTQTVKEIYSISQTWSQALAALLMTSASSSFPQNVRMVINHNLTGVPVFSAIETMKGSFRKLPNGIGMSAWLHASENAKYLQKILFKNSNDKVIPDYELFGWCFLNDNTKKILLVNLTDQPMQINVSGIIADSGSKCFTEYAEKNKVISKDTDINKEQITIKDNLLVLPAYSFTTVY